MSLQCLPRNYQSHIVFAMYLPECNLTVGWQRRSVEFVAKILICWTTQGMVGSDNPALYN